MGKGGGGGGGGVPANTTAVQTVREAPEIVDRRIGNGWRFKGGKECTDQHGHHEREDGDRDVLATHEGDRAFEDHLGNLLHCLAPGVAAEHIGSQDEGEDDCHKGGWEHEALKQRAGNSDVDHELSSDASRSVAWPRCVNRASGRASVGL